MPNINADNTEESLSELSKRIEKGLELAEYRMLREKAMRNEILIQSDIDGKVIKVSAREVFTKLYNEAVPTYDSTEVAK